MDLCNYLQSDTVCWGLQATVGTVAVALKERVPFVELWQMTPDVTLEGMGGRGGLLGL